ncbi:hypothetical protein RMATCC62417_16773 [Rhizopus microsporus]|nr:hypothetical protein RMATCC62417_16773 [Rhizopus microsporus]
MQSEKDTEDVTVDPAELTESIKEDISPKSFGRFEEEYFIHKIKRNRALSSVCKLTSSFIEEGSFSETFSIITSFGGGSISQDAMSVGDDSCS